MPIATDSHSVGAKGGTELIKERMVKNLPPELLDKVQIFFSRVEEEIREDIPSIYYAHDLAEDPEARKALGDGRYQRFNHAVFVSHWQKEKYMEKYDLPPSFCSVIQNFIEPFGQAEKLPRNGNQTRFIYTSTPQRGLNILYSAFDHLYQTNKDIHLDVFSSFKLYNRESMDEKYKPLFDLLVSHPAITYHGMVENNVVREALAKSDCWVLPSIWPETSCLSLIEAMSAGCLCIHPDFAALPETSGCLTAMYRMDQRLNHHATRLSSMMRVATETVKENADAALTTSTKWFADHNYNLDLGISRWKSLIEKLVEEFEV